MSEKVEKAGSARKVLVVEDEPAISEVCRRVLTEQGWEVDIATNGRIAQGMIRKTSYYLCLIDIRTPAMNGKELYQWLLEEHPALARRVVFTTGDVMGGEIQSFLEKAARPFLPKPFTPEELMTIMKHAERGQAAEDWGRNPALKP
ncbi:MAG TPA: response regulator [Dehalococcoidia bacterium]|jgi:CheY-like chemotaxis protein|nr:response regulator [Dehalococcoidia bacterium]